MTTIVTKQIHKSHKLVSLARPNLYKITNEPDWCCKYWFSTCNSMSKPYLHILLQQGIIGKLWLNSGKIWIALDNLLLHRQKFANHNAIRRANASWFLDFHLISSRTIMGAFLLKILFEFKDWKSHPMKRTKIQIHKILRI